MSNSVSVRLYSKEDANVEDSPVSSYLPIMLGMDQNVENISKRIQQLYLKNSSSCVKAHWQYNPNDPGVWVYSDRFETLGE